MSRTYNHNTKTCDHVEYKIDKSGSVRTVGGGYSSHKNINKIKRLATSKIRRVADKRRIMEEI